MRRWWHRAKRCGYSWFCSTPEDGHSTTGEHKCYLVSHLRLSHECLCGARLYP